ncbi:MAG TPA: hypothetical protein LFV92_04625 [Rickettsia endosymbiont of Ceroptres masudai]|nr:hypothetical protein [Rickettsia endosymbiont of Ceroptres masudai]
MISLHGSFISFPHGIVAWTCFSSLREELRSNSTKQGRKKILLYRIFLLFFLDCRVASLLAMMIRYPRNNACPHRRESSKTHKK